MNATDPAQFDISEQQTLTSGLEKLGYRSATSGLRSIPIFTRTTSGAELSNADIVVSQSEWGTLSCPAPVRPDDGAAIPSCHPLRSSRATASSRR